MEAKVKEQSRYGIVVAFSGLEYIKAEWRPVPAGLEAEAERNQYLEVREQPVEVAPIIEKIEAEEAVKVAPKKARGKQ